MLNKFLQIKMKKRGASLVGFYNEGIVQMGFIVYYAVVFPLAPLFSIITNLFEIDIKISSMGKYDKRNWAEVAHGIGNWENVMEFMSITAVPINFAVIFFTRVPTKSEEEFDQ